MDAESKAFIFISDVNINKKPTTINFTNTVKNKYREP